jgi:hypothetical protein
LQLDPENVDALVALAIMDLQTNEGYFSSEVTKLTVAFFWLCS